MTHYVGYHGTTLENAEKIRREGFVPSKKDHWLGQGVYFYDNFSSALNYGNVVIRADIYVKQDLLLDCFSFDGKKYLKQRTQQLSINNNNNQADRYGKVLAQMVTAAKGEQPFGFDVVRAPYHSDEIWGPLCKPFENIELHICVKNLQCISNISLISNIK
ncbi:TPA: hypothetical protein ACGXQL_004205 [Bacillus cereus]|uniref:hypothetical protein n=1 Tax=Bacillus TaxID=1386 RepID=UPI0001A10339|nr:MULTISPECIES: hypothetical protein [Bacillus]EEL84425.1 hypothetical protein bcere0029_58780 [Bacillus cereus AH1272]EEL90550.1 hypothetical protein bcere0030_55080 [Bacillus cereus AH1273]MED2680655.1 hypothetical protein [Bacillus thuringiensis]EKS7862058.1 hypothetical protein [Bacillus cereus]MBL3742291.1 hypothetical protein [Bacillus cereus]